MNEKQIVSFLRRERQKQGITYKQIAMLTGLPESTVGRFEMQQTRPMLRTVLKYADALGFELNLEKY